MAGEDFPVLYGEGLDESSQTELFLFLWGLSVFPPRRPLQRLLPLLEHLGAGWAPEGVSTCLLGQEVCSSGKNMGFGASHVSFQILAQPLTSHLTHKACPNSSFLPCHVGCNFLGVVRHEGHQAGESIYLTPNGMAMLLSKLKICQWRCREIRTPVHCWVEHTVRPAPVEVSMVASQDKARNHHVIQRF